MSNIPKARRLVQEALARNFVTQDLLREVLLLLDRKKPEFVARKAVKALTWRQKAKVRVLRASGMSLHDIAVRMGTNIGRVSEAINEEA